VYRYFCCENDYSENKSTFLKAFFIEMISPLTLFLILPAKLSVVGVGIFKADGGGYVYNLFI